MSIRLKAPLNQIVVGQALLLQLARATRHLRAAWSFTHFPMGPENQAAVRLAAAKGLVLNASTESRSVAAGLQRQGIPAVCVVPPDAPAVFRHQGVRFVACPASRRGSDGRKIQCISCGGRFGLPLCAQADRPFVIAFPAAAPAPRRQRPTAAEGLLPPVALDPLGLAPGLSSLGPSCGRAPTGIGPVAAPLSAPSPWPCSLPLPRRSAGLRRIRSCCSNPASRRSSASCSCGGGCRFAAPGSSSPTEKRKSPCWRRR